METGTELFDRIFSDVIEDLGEVNLYDIEDIDGVTCYEEEFSSNSGWYNYYKVSFRYKSNKYEIEYKTHTSDNVSDTECLYDTFKLIIADETNKVEIAIDKLINRIENTEIETLEDIVKYLEYIKKLTK